MNNLGIWYKYVKIQILNSGICRTRYKVKNKKNGN